MEIKCTVKELKELVENKKDTPVAERTDVSINNNDKVILASMLTNLKKYVKNLLLFRFNVIIFKKPVVIIL